MDVFDDTPTCNHFGPPSATLIGAQPPWGLLSGSLRSPSFRLPQGGWRRKESNLQKEIYTGAYADRAPWPTSYAGESFLYDVEGNIVSRSRNLRGIRNYLTRMPVREVRIEKLERGEGGVQIIFSGNQEDW
jgi:hypothetical protein